MLLMLMRGWLRKNELSQTSCNRVVRKLATSSASPQNAVTLSTRPVINASRCDHLVAIVVSRE